MELLLILVVAIGICIYFVRPFAVYRRALNREYFEFSGSVLPKRDQNLNMLIKSMKEFSVPPKLAVKILATYVDKGYTAGTKQLFQLIRGEKLEDIYSKDEDTKVKVLASLKPHYDSEMPKILDYEFTLRALFDEAYDNAYNSFLQMACAKEANRDDIKFEIVCLIYFSFDFAIAFTNRTTSGDRVRDLFISILGYRREIAEVIAARAIEYLNALKTEQSEEHRRLSFGDVFSKYLYGYPEIMASVWACKIHEHCLLLISNRLNESEYDAVIEGNKGNSISDAIIIRGIKQSSSRVAIKAQREWLNNNHPEWRKCGQQLLETDGKLYDEIEYCTNEGPKKIYFNITNCFG